MTTEQAPETRQRPRAGVLATYGFFGLVLAVYSVSLITRKNGSTTTLVDGWGVASFEMAMSLLVIVRAITSARDRAFGWLLGLGMVAWAAGDYAMTVETLHNGSPATLSLANVLWYGFFPLAYVGVMVLMRRDVRRFTIANYLDGVVACLLTGALFTAFAFHWVVKASGGDTENAVVNVIYPIGDLLLLGLCVMPILMLPKGKRTRWYLIAGACVFNAAGDICALFPGLVAHHAGFFFNADAWPVSLFLISAAVWLAPSTTDAAQEENSNGFAIPMVAGGLALGVLFIASLSRTQPGRHRLRQRHAPRLGAALRARPAPPAQADRRAPSAARRGG